MSINRNIMNLKRNFKLLLLLTLFSSAQATQISIPLSELQMMEIGKRIWKNECDGTISGLTSWNQGEGFPSLGIAHAIWYPAGKRDRFEESWPIMARALKIDGFPVEPWMLKSCPWFTRAAFMADLNGPRLTALRALLAKSVASQARYAAQRLEQALPKMLKNLPPAEAAKVESNFVRVAKEPLGFYALIDYVNFKGEGVNTAERYHGQGWGLLQVLEKMSTSGPALPAFVQAATKVLEQRVKNSPPARHESQWLPNWKHRVRTYQATGYRLQAKIRSSTIKIETIKNSDFL